MRDAMNTVSERASGLVLVALLASCRSQGAASASAPVPPAGAVAEHSAASEPAERALSPLEDPTFQHLNSVGGRYVVCWRAESGTLPRNQDCALEVWVFEGTEPVPGLAISVRGWMPEHGHGMLRVPRTVDQGDGSYRVEGVLLHMRGRWQLAFDLLRESQADVAQCEFEL